MSAPPERGSSGSAPPRDGAPGNAAAQARFTQESCQAGLLPTDPAATAIIAPSQATRAAEEDGAADAAANAAATVPRPPNANVAPDDAAAPATRRSPATDGSAVDEEVT